VDGLTIDRLTLNVEGMSPADARRLALEVARGLEAAVPGAHGDVPVLRLDLTAAADAGVSELARQIVAELVRQVRRLP
jgi:hypothetical protein